MMSKTCDNCVHKGSEIHEYPCGVCIYLFPLCGSLIKWEPKQDRTIDDKDNRVPTNAQKIRSMTDEELAEWIRNGISSDVCDYCDYNNGYCDGSPCRGKAEAQVIVDWLQQPYEED